MNIKKYIILYIILQSFSQVNILQKINIKTKFYYFIQIYFKKL